MQAVPQVLFCRALELLKPTLQGCTSFFPAKREVKREVGKAYQSVPGVAREPNFLRKSG